MKRNLLQFDSISLEYVPVYIEPLSLSELYTIVYNYGVSVETNNFESNKMVWRHFILTLLNELPPLFDDLELHCPVR